MIVRHSAEATGWVANGTGVRVAEATDQLANGTGVSGCVRRVDGWVVDGRSLSFEMVCITSTAEYRHLAAIGSTCEKHQGIKRTRRNRDRATLR